MKNIFTLLLIVFCSLSSFAQGSQVTVVVEITNVAVNDGIVYITVFANANEFRREEPSFHFAVESNRTVVSQQITLPAGEYLIAAFQDSNNNGQLDSNLFGVPRELVGISNYSGRGFPSRDFNRHKIPINSSTGTITIGLYKF